MVEEKILNLILDKVEGGRLDSIDNRLGTVETRFTDLERGQRKLSEKVDKLQKEMEVISKTVNRLLSLILTR